MLTRIKIADKWVGDRDDACFIVAEIGINHNGSVSIAKKMIDEAIKAGVDAVKFQAFKTDEFIADKKETITYKNKGKKISEPVYEMFKRLELSEKDFKEIFTYGKNKGIICFATPQNPSDLKMLLRIGVPLIKIGSDDLTTLPLVKEYALHGLPIIISTGMADLKEIKEAVKTILKTGNNKIIILHCVSLYPTNPEEVNLKRMESIKKNFGGIVGFSDHTDGIFASLAAVAMGAKVIEKHFTLDKNMFGPDQRLSANPKEMKRLVDGIRYIEKTMGSSIIKPTEREKEIKKHARRSIVASQNIKKREKITNEMIEYKKPGMGIPPKLSRLVVGKTAKCDIKKGELIIFKKIK